MCESSGDILLETGNNPCIHELIVHYYTNKGYIMCDLYSPLSSGLIITDPRSVAVNHAGLWIRRHQFESGRGYQYGAVLLGCS